MSVKINSKKIIAGAILVAFLASYLPGFSAAPIVQAQTMDTGDTLSVPIKEYGNTAEKYAHTGISFWGFPVEFTSLDYWVKYAVKKFIEETQDQVIDWIRKGDNGNPIFETNLNRFLNVVYEETGQNYIDSLRGDSSPACGYFKDSVVSSLSSYFGFPNSGYSSTKNTCTAEATVSKSKLNSFVAGDFINGGGWETWAAVSQNEDSNPIGSFLSNRDYVNTAIANKQGTEREKLMWGSGTHSLEDENGDVTTPGSVIDDQMKHVLESNLRQLELADSFDDVITALVDTYLDSLITDAKGLRGSGNGRTSTANTNTRDTYVKPTFPETSEGATSEDQNGGGTTSGGANGLQNVSIGGTATQSSSYLDEDDFLHEGRLALTGSRNRNPRSGVFISDPSAPHQNPWWQVDLGGLKEIDHIDITPRIDDGFGNDLTDFYVIVSETPIIGDGIPVEGNGVWVTGPIKPANPRDDITTVTPPEGTKGRYVRVQLGHKARLEIAGVEVFAKRAPIVSLMGSNPMTVKLNSNFSDPGAVAFDQFDKNISSSIITTGTVNTKVAGRYTITYSAKNSVGVTATVKRTVIVQ
ncbi:MAG: hypothetical protein K0S38_164 [Candidatus Paceibacter sp.]|jgi:hypothetical protein|nr:hypothetical protein [Candidatus Paceibacter sp.]